MCVGGSRSGLPPFSFLFGGLLLGLLCSGLADCFFEHLEGVDVGEEYCRPYEFVVSPSRDAFRGVVCWEGDVWCKGLCARCEEELVVCAAQDASGVWVNVNVDYL